MSSVITEPKCAVFFSFVSVVQHLINQRCQRMTFVFDDRSNQVIKLYSGKLIDCMSSSVLETWFILKIYVCRCEIYDFHRPTGPGNTHPRLFEFVRDHLKKSAETFVPPLYLQRQGKTV